MNSSMNFGTQPLAKVGNTSVWKYPSLGTFVWKYPSLGDDAVRGALWKASPTAKASGGRIGGSNWGGRIGGGNFGGRV